jgi:hypothetical protein
MRFVIPAAFLSGIVVSPALAAEVRVTVELPRLQVMEYYRPYTAVWIEKPDRTAVRTVAVWYNTRLRNRKGTAWLNNVREWWRATGRHLKLPADGVSGATRAPGVHQIVFRPGTSHFGTLPAGRYRLVVEAAREGGGRETVRVPFHWPAEGAQTASARGSRELRSVAISIRP